MDEVKHPHTEPAGQIDVSSVKHCLQQGDAKLALQYCHELLARDPQHIQTLLFAALASRSLRWLDDALDFINCALALAPNQPAIHSLTGDILLLQKRPEQALGALLQAKKLGDNSAQINFNIGSAYLALGIHEDAKNYFDQALSIAPQMVAAHVNKGLAEHSLMNLDSALDCFDTALCIDPGNIDAQWNKSHVLLTLGRYEEGFRLYETRWKHPQIQLKKRKFDSRLWLGQEPLSGKTILLFAEGGFGDTIQFIRYAKLFAPDVKLIIQCQVPLIELVKGMGLGAEVIAPGHTPPQHDFHCPLMSLPLAFSTMIDTVPQFDSYMYASDKHLKKWGAFIGQMAGPKVGIVARGSRSYANDKNRSFDLKALVALLPQHASFVVLQKELSDDERAFVDSCDKIIAPGEALESFSDTAAICTHLDQVISVDTGVAHLSGALGIPTTVLLAYRPDWRWGANRKITNWYPNCFLIRQSRPDDWESVLTALQHDFVFYKSTYYSKIKP
ncbi:MAG: tetratricopeptide repeat protein [Proteobacteria bacterium]|nr:tetratricopeptide repeat protein [Pseudomonadota bacterium]MDA0844296.1 tetratricopeptide repeat protein [Pseudomonadota bacterium]